MSTSVIQPSLAGGEVGPNMAGRVDLAKYRTAVRLARNHFVDYRGGLPNRSGTQFCARARASEAVSGVAGRPRLIPFTFSTLQAYVLEFGNRYMRVYMDGASVLEPSFAITGATQASPCQLTAVGHDFAAGDTVFVSGVVGMTGLNDGTYLVAGTGTNVLTLKDLDGNPFNTIAMGAYVSGGTVARVFTLATPYAVADLPLVKFTQSADTMTLTHPSYAPNDLTRSQHWAWTLTAITFAAKIQPPMVLTATAVLGGGSTSYQYVVTSVSASGEESNASPVLGLIGCKTFAQGTATTPQAITCDWSTSAVAGAVSYNIYRAPEVPNGAPPAGSLFGLIGSTAGMSFTDTNFLPNFSQGPPQHQNPLAGNNPGCVDYFQQRKTFAASLAQPETLWTTKSGNYTNMDTSNPSRDDDALTATLSAKQVNAIKHLVPMPTGLVILTSSGAWLYSGGGTGTAVQPITPSNQVAQPQSFNGCSDLPPLVINYDILFNQARGAYVRDLSFNYFLNNYTGTDMSVLASHLFTGHVLMEWCWAEEPHKIIWAVRDDGVLLSLTYLKEQDVYGWCHHDTAGDFFRSVASIPEGQENAVYVVVQRSVQNGWRYYVERLHTRDMGGDATRGIPADVRLAWFVDCGLAYPLTQPAATLTPPALTASSNSMGTPSFTGSGSFQTDAAVTVKAGDVLEINGGVGTVTVGCTAGTSFTATMTQPMLNLLPAPSGSWSCTTPISTVSGLGHLEGRTVAILEDGNVQPRQSVTNGTIALQQPGTRITIGLPMQAQGRTLGIDVGEPTIQGKRKNINSVTVRVQDTRGLKLGPDFNSLTLMKEGGGPYANPIPLQTRDERLNIANKWQVPGELYWQQDDPLPCTILALIPEIVVGDS